MALQRRSTQPLKANPRRCTSARLQHQGGAPSKGLPNSRFVDARGRLRAVRAGLSKEIPARRICGVFWGGSRCVRDIEAAALAATWGTWRPILPPRNGPSPDLGSPRGALPETQAVPGRPARRPQAPSRACACSSMLSRALVAIRRVSIASQTVVAASASVAQAARVPAVSSFAASSANATPDISAASAMAPQARQNRRAESTRRGFSPLGHVRPSGRNCCTDCCTLEAGFIGVPKGSRTPVTAVKGTRSLWTAFRYRLPFPVIACQ